MPIWLRRFNINKINKFLEKQKQAMEGQSAPDPEKIKRGPNIQPSSTYNFKK